MHQLLDIVGLVLDTATWRDLNGGGSRLQVDRLRACDHLKGVPRLILGEEVSSVHDLPKLSLCAAPARKPFVDDDVHGTGLGVHVFHFLSGLLLPVLKVFHEGALLALLPPPAPPVAVSAPAHFLILLKR